MGLGDFFSKYKADREKKTLMKNIRRLIHQDLQHEDRLRAAEFLAEVGTEEALYGLLRRYDMSLDKNYMDQDEKTFVHDIVVSKGEAAIEPIERFLRASENVSWPERILSSILQDDDKVVEVLLEVIRVEREEGNDMRAGKRANLIDLFSRYKDPRIAAAIVPFLDDFDESVRITCINVLDTQGDETAAGPLLDLATSEEEDSFRVKSRVVDCFANHGWKVPTEYRDGVKPLLDPGTTMNGSGVISR